MSGGIGGSNGVVGGAGGTIDPNTGAATAGGTPTTTMVSRGGGGGGGSAGGGAGGAGQTTFGAGGGSTMPMQLQGGSGGAGGTDLIGPEAVSTGSNATSGTAGNGLAGQPGTAAHQDDIGGGGGEGGYGLILTGTGSFSNTGALTGGAGGAGGFDTSGSVNAVSGEGGDGGIAIDVLGTGVALTNSAALTGGNAGTGGQTTYGSGQPTTVYGKGGAAIAGAGLTIYNSGNLTGGLNGDGSQGTAIDFTGGANTLDPLGGTITGGIVYTGSLALESNNTSNAVNYSGVSGTGSLDIPQYNSVNLLGDNTISGATTVEGNLVFGDSLAYGAVGTDALNGSVSITGYGTLTVYLAPGSTTTLGAVSGDGVLNIDTGAAIVSSDTVTGNSGVAGTNNSGTLTLTGSATGSIHNMNTLNLAPIGAATVTGPIANGGGLVLGPTGATPLTISGVISDLNGTAGSVDAKSGTTILSGANTYSGDTYLQGGIIDAENDSAFGTGTVYAFDPEIDYGPAAGATGDAATGATQANNIVLEVASPASGDPTILKVAGGFTETISGAITTDTSNPNADPNQPLVIDGAGKLLLQGANSFSGGITLGGSGTLDLDSANASGASGGTGTNGAVTFATGSTATLRIDGAATSGPNYDFTYADPISNFAYGETIDLASLLYEPQATTSVTLSGTTLTVSAVSDGTDTATLTNFADASGQTGLFTTMDDGYGGTLVALTPPPAKPTIDGVQTDTQATTSEAPLQPFSLALVGDTNNGGANSDTLTITQTGTGTLSGTGLTPNGDNTYTLTGTAAAITTSLDALVFTPVGVPNTPVTTSFTLQAADAAAGTSSATSAAVTVTDTDPAVAPTITRSPAPTYALTTLATFTGANGAYSSGGLTLDGAGNLYGTTAGGGASGDGTVFEIVESTGTLQTLATFTGDNGASPSAGLIFDSAGNLYGTTTGGAYTSGTVFEIVKSTGTLQTLATFTGDNGASPSAGLIFDGAGNLYGTTSSGGASSQGTVFEIVASTGALQTLATFTGGNGANPEGSLTADSAGNLYGTTPYGGRSEPSTVFEIVKSTGALQTLTTLRGDPNAGLILDSAGNLYGTSAGGGNSGDGFVFEFVKSTGALQTLATFTGANGSRPYADLTADGAGNLYGTTHLGGASQDGTVFEIVKSTDALQTLANFTGDNGFGPSSGLIFDGAGDLYGTTQQGGASNDGTVFELSPTPLMTTSEAPVTPFSGVTIGDVNGGGGTDTLTITVGGSGGTLSGTGLTGGTNGIYTLTGTAAAITTNLDALSFTPVGQPGTSSTSTFALSDTSTAFATPAADSLTTVVDTDPLSGSGTEMIGSSPLMVTNSTPSTFSGTIADGSSGPGAVVVNDTAPLTLTGTNTYTGGTTINSGTLIASDNGRALSSGPVMVAAGATLGLLNDTSGTVYLQGTTISGAGTLEKTGTGTTRIGGVNGTIGGSADTVNVSLAQGATIDVEGGILGGSSNYQANYADNQGGLNIGSGGTFDGVEGTIIVDALTGSGTLEGGYNSAGSTTIGVAGGSGTFSGTIADNNALASGALSLTKTGAGTETLTGTDTYTGGTTINAGTLIAADNGRALSSGPVTIAAGATLGLLNDTGNSVFLQGTTISGAGTLQKTGTGTTRIGGVNGTVGGSADTVTIALAQGAVIDVEGGILAGSSNYQANYTNNQGSLNIAAGAIFDGVEGTIIVDALTGSGTLEGGYNSAGSTTIGVAGGSGTFSGTIANNNALTSGVMALIKAGAGTETLTGADTYTGGTTLDGGTLDLDALGAAGTGTITFGGAATLEIHAAALTGGAGQQDFANLIAGATSASQVIDLTSLAYAAGSTNATLSGTSLAVTDGGASVMLHLASAQAQSSFTTASDGHGGTLVYDPPITTPGRIDHDWIAAAMEPFGSGGDDLHAGSAPHDPYGVAALGASTESHAATMFGQHGGGKA